MSKILRIIECVILGLFFGLPLLIVCLVATLIITDIVSDTDVLGPWALWSLVPALVIGAFFLRSWVAHAYQMNTKILAAVYLFHSVVAAGLGMGIPLLNFALCIAAGPYIARRMHLEQADHHTAKLAFKRTARFCAAAMVMVCCLIAFWGAIGGVIDSRFDTPWLSFTITIPVFFALVFSGTAVLVLLHYVLTSLTANITYRLHTPKAVRKSPPTFSS